MAKPLWHKQTQDPNQTQDDSVYQGILVLEGCRLLDNLDLHPKVAGSNPEGFFFFVVVSNQRNKDLVINRTQF